MIRKIRLLLRRRREEIMSRTTFERGESVLALDEIKCWFRRSSQIRWHAAEQ